MYFYRPIKFKNWTKATLEELIKAVENSLYEFSQTRAFDSGVRQAETEAYLQGLKDAKKLIKKTNKEENWEGNNWKGEKASKSAKHKWLDSHFGKPLTCENPYCEGKSKKFEWCIKKGKNYSHNRKDYLRLCRSCHRKYDWSDEKKDKAIKNLHWFTKKIRINKYGTKYKENYL